MAEVKIDRLMAADCMLGLQQWQVRYGIGDRQLVKFLAATTTTLGQMLGLSPEEVVDGATQIAETAFFAESPPSLTGCGVQGCECGPSNFAVLDDDFETDDDADDDSDDTIVLLPAEDWRNAK